MSVLINASTSTGLVQSADTSGEIELQSNGTTALKVNTNEGIQILNCLGVGNATPSTSGAGITFPATQSASTDANTLDDYEEGTFTPSSFTGGGSVSSYQASYVKIGRQVTCYIAINGTSLTTTAASTTLAGLPFVPNNSPTASYYIGICMNGQTTNSGAVQAFSDSRLYWAVSIASTNQISVTISYIV